jgi:hypothetical protein
MTMIEIQEAHVARLLAAHAKIGPRSAGLMFARTARASKKRTIQQLVAKGYDEAHAQQITRDAYDMFKLELDARD